MKKQRGRPAASASRKRLAVVLAVVAAALVAAPAIRADTPVWSPTPDLTVEATSAAGATNTYTDPTVTDPANDLSGPPVCAPASTNTFQIGTTPVTCTVTDAQLGAVSVMFNVIVVDTTAPTISVPSPMTVQATSSAGAPVNYTVTATDAVDPNPTLSCSPVSGGTFVLGTTNVNCSAQDATGNHSSASFTVTVVDTTPPVLNLPAPISMPATSPSGAAVTFTATATDAIDPNPNVSCTPASGATFPVGVTTVNCTARDASNNQATGSFTVTVTDTTPPTLNLPGNIAAVATSAAGATVPFTVTATDAIDPNPSVSCTPQSGATFPIGVTTVNCTARDASNNQATGSFTVTVTDTTPPALNLPGNIAVGATSAAGATVTFSVAATDAVDPHPSVSCTPPSGATFPVGVTTVNCTARDASNNQATGSFSITVTDVTPPVFSSVSTLTYEANGPNGSSPNYTPPTAVDAVDGPVIPSCAPLPNTLLSLGAHTVTCTATDAAHNATTTTFTINIVDTTPPVLTVPAALTLSTTGSGLPASNASIAAFLGSAVAHDIVDLTVNVTNNAPAVFPLGTTVVTFIATDASGNTATGSASIIVVVQTGVFTPPPAVVDRTPPDDVTGVKATGGGGQVTLTWAAPSAPDFDHVVVVRSDATGGSPAPVYTGSGSTFVDTSVHSGTEYRYVITAYDHAGNRSAGIALLVKPSPAVLISPRAGARVAKAPLLAWVSSAGASYYNVQLFRGGRKILSMWPLANHVQLPKKWRFEGHKYTLSRGTYTWYVWPGLGARKVKHYGAVLGSSTFVVG